VRLFVPTDIEAHMIEQHGSSPTRVSAVRSEFPDKAQQVIEHSHKYMHAAGFADHDHNDERVTNE